MNISCSYAMLNLTKMAKKPQTTYQAASSSAFPHLYEQKQ